MPKTTTTSTVTQQDLKVQEKTPTKRVSKKVTETVAPATPVTETVAPATPATETVAPATETVAPAVPAVPTKRSRKAPVVAPVVAPVATSEVTEATATVPVAVPASDSPNLEVSAEADTLILSVSGISHANIQSVVTGLLDLEKQVSSYRVALRNVLRGFDRLSKEHSKVHARLVSVTTERNDLKKTLSELQLSTRKSKAERKAARKQNPNFVRGFDRLCELSPDLCAFLGVPVGSHRSRNQVMTVIRAYIVEHDLKCKEEKRGWQFLPDAKLTALLGPAQHPLKNSKKEKDRILDLGYSHFNIQSYLNNHILKTVPLPESTPVSVPSA